MYSQGLVWLSPEQIVLRNKEFCYFSHINERSIVKLFDSFLLGGKFNRKSRNVEVIQESFDLMRRHIQFNHDVQTRNYSEILRPEYLNHKYTNIPYSNELAWHSPKDILFIFGEILEMDKNYTTEFIGDLAKTGLIIGQFHRGEQCFHINARSFAQLLKYRDFILENYKLLK